MPARSHVRLVAAALVAAAANSAACAQDGLRGIATTIDGARHTGALVVADGKARIATSSGDVAFAVEEMTSFEIDGAVTATAAAPHRIWLRSGQEFPATSLDGAAAAAGKPATLRFTTPGGIVVEVPLATVRAIRHGGPERPAPALFATDLKQPPSTEDLIYVVKDGQAQRSSVVVGAIGSERIDFTLRGSAFEFATSGLAAVVFGASTGFAPDRQPKPRTSVALTSGETFEGKLEALDAANARLRLDEGSEVTVPAKQLARLQVASDRLVWLTDLKPQIEQTPAFDRVWPIAIDRTPFASGLVLGGKTFTHGICMVPRTRLVYDLAGRFDVFEATIGIDDRGGPEAHALFRVFVDGKLAWESGPRTRGQAPEAIRVELQKAKQLAIEVDFGKNYDLGDYCDWADARVLQR